MLKKLLLTALGMLLVAAHDAVALRSELREMMSQKGRELQLTSPPSTDNESSNADYHFNLYLAHGILMAIAFGIILPIGALFPALTICRNRPDNQWFKYHQFFQTFFMLIAVTGLLIIMFNIALIDGSLSRMVNKSPHGPLGIALMVIVFVQFMFGACRPHAPATRDQQKSGTRLAFEAIHPQMGHIIIVLAAVQLWYGYRFLINYVSSAYQRNAILIWAYVHAIAMPVIFFALVLHSRCRTGKASFGFGGNAHTNPMPPPPRNVADIKPSNAANSLNSHNPVTENLQYGPGVVRNYPSSNNSQPQMAVV